jgi:hypothetical protein
MDVARLARGVRFVVSQPAGHVLFERRESMIVLTDRR